MIRLTNLADYAVLLMGQIARGYDSGHLFSAQGLSDCTKIPLPTVSKILNLLGKAGLLISHRGLKGGFTLSRSANEISMTDIIEAIDGPISLTHCVGQSTKDCTLEDSCTMKPHWQVINNTIRAALDQVQLQTLCTAESGQNTPPADCGILSGTTHNAGSAMASLLEKELGTDAHPKQGLKPQ